MKAVLLAASIGWQTQYDDKGRPKGRFVGVSVSWMPYEMSYKRCGYNHHITEEFAARMRHDPRLIEMQVDAVVRCFVNGAARLMEQKMSEVSDLTDACDELRRGLPDGFRAFLENDNDVWIHHFCHVLNVPKGSYTIVCKDGKIDPKGMGRVNGTEVIVPAQSALIMHQ